MKKILLLSFFIFSFSLSKAQWVTIPDANFVAWLQTNYPGCMNGNQMNTSCSAIVTATYVNCNNSNISNLTGIQYFSSMNYLNCDGNNLTSLPPLPNTLKNLYCSGNNLTGLPNLPTMLLGLDCSFNQILNLPILPNSLTGIDCSYNLLTNLPSLPNSLSGLGCAGNALTTINSLPLNLTTFSCEYNQISSLPNLPNSLTWIYCNNNQITSFQNLPSNLNHLYCQNNLISNLPPISNSLILLDCSSNQLSSLPALPNSLTDLNCSNNSILNLPLLPVNLTMLACGMNLLSSLPPLPPSLLNLICSINQLTSLPPLPNSMIGNLYCTENLLTSLPNLPASLKGLACRGNQLTSLPALPDSLYSFIVNNNPNLMCMPVLEKFKGSYLAFDISNTGITCLPNVIQHTGSIPAIDTMPICSGCVYPSGITTSNIGALTATVNWSSECCNEYRIQYRVIGTTTWTLKIANASASSKILNGLSPNTTYDLRMRVVCTGGTSFSAWSPIQNFTTIGSCSPPIGITVNNVLQTQATFNWNAVASAYSYQLLIRKQGTSAWFPFTILAPSTTQLVQWLTNNTTYEYKLKTICNASGTPSSSWTAIQTFTTPLRLEDVSENEASKIFVYPNPASEQLTIDNGQLTITEIKVTDMIGKTVFVANPNPETTNPKLTLDISTFPSGMYFIEITDSEKKMHDGKFVVVR